jgi:hypothetical protein
MAWASLCMVLGVFKWDLPIPLCCYGSQKGTKWSMADRSGHFRVVTKPTPSYFWSASRGATDPPARR